MRGNDEVEGENRSSVHSRTGIAIGRFGSAAIYDDLGLRRPAHPGAFALLGTSVATAELGAEFMGSFLDQLMRDRQIFRGCPRIVLVAYADEADFRLRKVEVGFYSSIYW